jgi:hypothetical protein
VGTTGTQSGETGGPDRDTANAPDFTPEMGNVNAPAGGKNLPKDQRDDSSPNRNAS